MRWGVFSLKWALGWREDSLRAVARASSICESRTMFMSFGSVDCRGSRDNVEHVLGLCPLM